MKTFNEFITESTSGGVFPAQESQYWAQLRRKRKTYTRIIRVDAEKLYAEYVRSQGSFATNLRDVKLDHIRDVIDRGEKIDSYPSVAIMPNGRIDVADGRHRIKVAAERHMAIDIGIEKTVKPAVYAHLTEQFVKGIDAAHGYTEIYKNPTRSELENFAVDTSVAKPLQKRYGSNIRYLGAWVNDKNLFVFDRSTAEHSDVINKLRTVIDKSYLPIYLYYFPDSKTVAVRPSSWSWSHDSSAPDSAAITRMAKRHPAFKIFSTVVDAEENWMNG